MAIVAGIEQLYYDDRSWCTYYGAIRGAFVGWRAAAMWAKNYINLVH